MPVRRIGGEVTTTTTLDPLVFDQSAFCGCADPGECPPECCGVAACGCEDIPQELFVTVNTLEGIAGCSCSPVPFVVSISYDSGSETWTGSSDFGGCTNKEIFLTLSCGGSTCDDFRLGIVIVDHNSETECVTPMSLTPFPGCSCGPLDLDFATNEDLADCCDGPGPAITLIDVTE